MPQICANRAQWLMVAIAVIFVVLPAHAADTPAQLPRSDGKPANITKAGGEQAGALGVVEKYCFSCHGSKKQKGDVRLDALPSFQGEARSDLFSRMQEQVYFGDMPPDDHEQPTDAERKVLVDWLGAELRPFGPSKLEDKLRQPDYGNRLDHDKLFSGEFKDLKGFTHDRRWLISPYIFSEKVASISRGPKKGIGSRGSYGLANPFSLLPGDGVLYYANDAYNGGQLLTMMNNAKILADQVLEKAALNDAFSPTITAIMAKEWAYVQRLASREAFVEANIARLCEDIYKEKNQALLPPFVPVQLADAPASSKKDSFHYSSLGVEEMSLLVRTVSKYDSKDQSETLRKCEQEWFNAGDTEFDIGRRLSFLKKFPAEFRGYMEQKMKKRAPEIKPPAASEVELIKQSILSFRKVGDRYSDIKNKCFTAWREQFERDRAAAGSPSVDEITALINQLFLDVLERLPSDGERTSYVNSAKEKFGSLTREQAIKDIYQSIVLDSDFVYRHEFGTGQSDQYGRRMLSPRDASYALSYALTDSSPDKELAEAARSGRLGTREDYKREVVRMLNRRDQPYTIDSNIRGKRMNERVTDLPIRKLRFFREFFGYAGLLQIFKDDERLGAGYGSSKYKLVDDADQLMDYLLHDDRKVFERMLTTDSFFVVHDGDNEKMKQASDRIREVYDYFKDKNWRNFKSSDLAKHGEFLRKNGANLQEMKFFAPFMVEIEALFDKGQKQAVPAVHRIAGPLNGSMTIFYNIDRANWDYPTVQPAPVPHRKGMLTHPAWLTAHAHNTETDPIKRGRWVREKLLAGAIPDVPVTVDAVIPDDAHKTLRQRLEKKTQDTYCWGCHQHMNPLGLPFEIFDDFGRYRAEERLEYPENLITIKKAKNEQPVPFADTRPMYKTLPVDSRGSLEGSGDKALDGAVTDALDLIDRLARSARVRQSIIRHAFRYFLGRNEMLSDSQTLINADKAYLESGGSFDAVIVSLLTSDSFIYRKSLEK